MKALYPYSIQYEDKYTGTTGDRPQFNKLKKDVKKHIDKGEEVTVVFDSVSRMSRNAEEGVQQYMEWYDMGVHLIFLNEPHINTDVYGEQLRNADKTKETITNIDYLPIAVGIAETLRNIATKQIILAFEQAQKERDDISKRTREGLMYAKEVRGVTLGRPKGTTRSHKNEQRVTELILELHKDYGGTWNDKRIIFYIRGELGTLDRNLYYYCKKQLKEQKEKVLLNPTAVTDK